METAKIDACKVRKDRNSNKDFLLLIMMLTVFGPLFV